MGRATGVETQASAFVSRGEVVLREMKKPSPGKRKSILQVLQLNTPDGLIPCPTSPEEYCSSKSFALSPSYGLISRGSACSGL